MLRSFRVSNHRSIRDEQELSMLSVYDKERKVMPAAGIYGANASGKTALVDAFRFMRSAVIDSFRIWNPDGGVPRAPFRLDVSALVEPSSFVIDIEVDEIVYTYGFEVNGQQVNDEWLYAYPENRKRVVYERAGNEVKFGSTVSNYRSLSGELNRFLRSNALVLSTAKQVLKLPEINPVYRWFDSDLRIHAAEPCEGVDEQQLAEAIRRRPGVVHLLRAADVGISAVNVEESAVSLTPAENSMLDSLRDAETNAFERLNEHQAELDRVERESPDTPTDDDLEEIAAIRGFVYAAQRSSANIRSQVDQLLSGRKRAQILFAHGEGDMALTLAEESGGTVAWLRLMVASFDVLSNGGVLVVDELESNLHPKLTGHLLEAFQEPFLNPQQAQLVFTTHDSVLLGPAWGSSNLTRDEVWFVEKDKQGTSKVFSLSDFQPRKNERIDRGYIHGTFGAVPRTDQYDMRLALAEAGVIDEPSKESR